MAQFIMTVIGAKTKIAVSNKMIEIRGSNHKLELFPSEARFIISSRAKLACFPRAPQGKTDFLFCCLVGVRLDVIQSSDVKVHYGFPGNRLPSMTNGERQVQPALSCFIHEELTGFFHL